MLLRTTLSLLPFAAWLVLEDSGAADDGTDDTDEQDATGDRDGAGGATSDTDELGEAGKKALQREREARKEAEKARAALEKRIAEFERKQREAEEAKAKEQGEWEQLAQQRERELTELREQLTQRETAALRASIARKHNLPEDALEFVTGDDEAAIEASVKKLAKLAARREDVDTDAGRRTSTSRSKQSESLLATYTFGKRR